jgi:hypothetical protein
LGATGTGKTFTMASLIAEIQKPTLVMAHNKTLAAQLYAEFKDFFPDNAVEYFVSYYDYYQPEAYVPRHDLYIEKESDINEEIERLRLAATTSLMSRKDVVMVASVSCIYGIGQPGGVRARGHQPGVRLYLPAQRLAAAVDREPVPAQRHGAEPGYLQGAGRHPGDHPGLPGPQLVTGSLFSATRSSA